MPHRRCLAFLSTKLEDTPFWGNWSPSTFLFVMFKVAVDYILFVFHCSNETWHGILCFTLKSRVSSADGVGDHVDLVLCHHSACARLTCLAFLSAKLEDTPFWGNWSPSTFLCVMFKVAVDYILLCFTAQMKPDMVFRFHVKVKGVFGWWRRRPCRRGFVPPLSMCTCTCLAFLSTKLEDTPFWGNWSPSIFLCVMF